MGRINPKAMSKMMKQLGIKSEELSVKKVVFEMNDKKLLIENPSVTLIEMQGIKTFQVMGDIKEEKLKEIPEEDIELVVSQTSASKEEAKKTLMECNGDIAEAITKLKKE
jgi:nascent polypeptide-associated complex subunit alpha